MAINPIHILVGEEPYLLERRQKDLLAQAVPPALASFNLDKFSAKTESIARIIDACQTLPMMSERRAVLVKDVEDWDKEDLERLLAYFQNPSPTTCLVLVATKVDGRSKAWKQAAPFIETFKVPYEREMPAWIASEARQMGITLDAEAAHVLVDSMGASLQAISSTLQKLKIFLHPKTSANLKDVEGVLDGFSTRTVFDLAEKLGQKKRGEASFLIDQMLTKGEPPVRLLMMVARHFRLLRLARQGMAERKGPPEIASLLGVPPFFAKDYLAQARFFTDPSLKKIHRLLLATDKQLKGSPLEGKTILNGFMHQVCAAG